MRAPRYIIIQHLAIQALYDNWFEKSDRQCRKVLFEKMASQWLDKSLFFCWNFFADRDNKYDLSNDVVQKTYTKVYIRVDDRTKAHIANLRNYFFRSLKLNCTREILLIAIKNSRYWDEANDKMSNRIYHHEDQKSNEIEGQIVKIHQALAKCSQKDRQMFWLRFKEEYSIKAIAQQLGIAEGTVKSRIFYLKKRLRKEL